MKIDELVNLTRQELRHGQQQDTGNHLLKGIQLWGFGFNMIY